MLCKAKPGRKGLRPLAAETIENAREIAKGSDPFALKLRDGRHADGLNLRP